MPPLKDHNIDTKQINGSTTTTSTYSKWKKVKSLNFAQTNREHLINSQVNRSHTHSHTHARMNNFGFCFSLIDIHYFELTFSVVNSFSLRYML